MRAALSGEVGEESLAADGAVWVWRCGVDLTVGEGGLAFGVPQVKGEESTAHEMGLAGEELEGFGDLKGGCQVDGGREDSSCIAGFDGARGGLGEDAGEAGGGGVGDLE